MPGEHPQLNPDAPAPRSPRFLRWLDAPWIRDDWAQEAFAIQQRDRVGSRIHLACALIACFFATSPISIVEFAAVPVMFAAVARTTMVWRLWWHLILQPAMLATIAFGLFAVLSMSWSPDRGRGLAELSEFRWVLLVFALWPMMQRRQLLVAAYALGFLATHLGQGYQLVVQSFALDWPMWDRLPDRISAWWSPVAGGTALTGALGLHLAAAVWGRHRWRLIGLAGAGITALGILATGTRGAWLAGLALITLAGLIALIGARRKALPMRAHPKPIALACVGIVLVGVLAWSLLGSSLSARIAEARDELARAIQSGDRDSNLGGRLLMWEQARDAFLSHPIRGVGVGGYRAWAVEHLTQQGSPELTSRIHDHAHSTPIHIASELGIVGLTLFGLVITSTLWAGFTRWGPVHSGYELAPAMALVGLLLAGLFQTLHVNSHNAIQLWLLIALCPVWHPTQLRARR